MITTKRKNEELGGPMTQRALMMAMLQANGGHFLLQQEDMRPSILTGAEGAVVFESHQVDCNLDCYYVSNEELAEMEYDLADAVLNANPLATRIVEEYAAAHPDKITPHPVGRGRNFTGFKPSFGKPWVGQIVWQTPEQKDAQRMSYLVVKCSREQLRDPSEVERIIRSAFEATPRTAGRGENFNIEG